MRVNHNWVPKCILKDILSDIFFSCKSVEPPQLHVETMLCYIGAVVENFCTSKEVEVIGKKSVGAMLAQFGKDKDEQYSYGEYKTQ